MILTAIYASQILNPGDTFASIIASAGNDRITDTDSSALEGIAIQSTDSGNGTWQYSLNNGSTWTATGSVSPTSALLLRATDRIRFMPDGVNATTGSIGFRAWDQSAGTPGTKVSVANNGGTRAFSTATETASIVVIAYQNHSPSGTDATTSILEDATFTFAASNFGFNDLLDSPANNFVDVETTTLPAPLEGVLELGVEFVFAGQVIAAASLNNLRFVTTANLNGANKGSFTFRVRDDGGVANGGMDLDPSPNTFAFNITAVNDPPSGTDATRTIVKNAAYTFNAIDFGYEDMGNTPSNVFVAVTIATLPLPSEGTLKLAGANVAVGQFIPVPTTRR